MDDLNYGSFVDKNAMVNIYGTRTQVFYMHNIFIKFIQKQIFHVLGFIPINCCPKIWCLTW